MKEGRGEGEREREREREREKRKKDTIIMHIISVKTINTIHGQNEREGGRE